MTRPFISCALSPVYALSLIACAADGPPATPVTAATTTASSAAPVPVAAVPASEPSAQHANAPVNPIMTRTLSPGIDGKTPKSECDKDSDCKSSERCQHPTCQPLKPECMFAKCVAK